MAIDPALMGVLSLSTMKKAERTRAEEGTFLTLVPGPPATRAMFSAFAVGNVARDSLRREKKAATAVLAAVEAIVAGSTATDAFAAQPALRDLAPDVLASRFSDSFGAVDGGVRPSGGSNDTKELWTALHLATDMLIEAIGRTKNQLFTSDEAVKYDAYLDLVSGAERDQIVKPAEDD